MFKKQSIKDYYEYLLASLSLFAIYISFFSAYKYAYFGEMKAGKYLFIIIGFILFFFAYILEMKQQYDNNQVRSIAGVIFLTLLLLLPSVKELISNSSVYALCIIVGGLFLILILVISDRHYWIHLLFNAKAGIAIAATLIVLISSITYLRYHTVYFLWDAHDMYELVSEGDIYSLFDFSELSLSMHISYSFTALCIIASLFLGNAMMGQAIVGIVLYVLGVYGFYRCVELFSKNPTDKNTSSIKALLTVLFACSPYMLGMITYSYPDYAIWCLTPILTYSLFSKKYILVEYIGVFYIFCKETAVITYVALIVGFYLCNAVKEKKFFYEFSRYILMSIPCIMWLISYIFVGHWDGNGEFAFNLEYIKDKLLVYFALNFNWLIITALLLVIAICIKKKLIIVGSEEVLSIVFSAVAYFVFSILFKTVNHPRYIDALVAQLYLLAAHMIIVFADGISKKAAAFITSGLITVMLIQSFVTIDPVMLRAFKNINVGGARLVTTSEILSDGMAYNRQYQGWGGATDKALEGIVGNEDSIVFFPALYNDTWHFDAMGWYEILNDKSETVVTGYWDPIRKTRMTSSGDEYVISYLTHIVNNNFEFDLKDDQHGYYIYSELAGSEMVDAINAKFNSSIKTFEYKGWKVNRIEFWN